MPVVARDVNPLSRVLQISRVHVHFHLLNHSITSTTFVLFITNHRYDSVGISSNCLWQI